MHRPLSIIQCPPNSTSNREIFNLFSSLFLPHLTQRSFPSSPPPFLIHCSFLSCCSAALTLLHIHSFWVRRAVWFTVTHFGIHSPAVTNEFYEHPHSLLHHPLPSDYKYSSAANPFTILTTPIASKTCCRFIIFTAHVLWLSTERHNHSKETE